MKNNTGVSRKQGCSGIIVKIVGILFAACQFFPLIWVFCFSLCKDNELFTSTLLKISIPPQWGNYVTAFVQGHILRFGINSILVTAVTVLLTDYLSLTLAYAFTRMKWKLNKYVFYGILLGMMIPIHTTLLPNFLIFTKLHLINTPWALIIPYTAFALPSGVFIMCGFLESVPKSLEEAAVLDGCSIFKVIYNVVFPLTKTPLVTVTVMTFMSCWNEFIMAMTYLNSDKYYTLPFAVQEFAGKYSSRYSVQFAVMVLSSLPAVLIYVFLNKYITKGVAFGAVKE